MERPGLKTTGAEKRRAVTKNKIRKPSGSTDRRQFLTIEETTSFSRRPLLHDVATNPTEIFFYKV
jgi:hypothetical protein